MPTRLGKCAALALGCLAAASMFSAPLAGSARAPVRPVMVAGNGDMDACLSTSFVKPLRKGGYLSVRAGPSVRSKETGRLRAGFAVWNCDSHGDWVGIVYRAGQRSQNEGIACDLGPNETPRRPYRGDCRSGWVHASYLLSLAG